MNLNKSQDQKSVAQTLSKLTGGFRAATMYPNKLGLAELKPLQISQLIQESKVAAVDNTGLNKSQGNKQGRINVKTAWEHL